MTRDELQRLIDIIVEELAARHGPAAPARCACHCGARRLLSGPAARRDRRRRDARRRARHRRRARRGGGDDRSHAAQARRHARRTSKSCAAKRRSSSSRPSASTRPGWRRCAKLLPGTGVRVCSVVGFPLGATTPDVKGYETRRAIFDGAREIDMVINVGALKSGDLRAGRARHRGGDRARAATAASSAR